MLESLQSNDPDAITNAIDYAKFRSCSHHAVICVYDEAGNVIETHEHSGEFKEWRIFTRTTSQFLIKRICHKRIRPEKTVFKGGVFPSNSC